MRTIVTMTTLKRDQYTINSTVSCLVFESTLLRG
jgi:hypothetical protein